MKENDPMKENGTVAPLRTCVSPDGTFVYGLHEPDYSVTNLREKDERFCLGRNENDAHCFNEANFPPGDVDVPGADPIYEIPNPFPFKGTTYIGKVWADRTAQDLNRIAIAKPPAVSLGKTVQTHFSAPDAGAFIKALPRPLQLALAVTSTDPDDLKALAQVCCRFTIDPATGAPDGLRYSERADGRRRAKISDEQLFDCVANNPNLPDAWKQIMVLRPGVQGDSEIVGQQQRGESHVFEYLRRNSYIPWGHYAANMAHDSIRYAAGRLVPADMAAMRHLYYQRTYVRVARALNLAVSEQRKSLTIEQLEQIRTQIASALKDQAAVNALPFTATLWGWNYGFDYAPNGYRLHASHQQIHQQYALIPATVPGTGENNAPEALPSFACGDMIHEFIQAFRQQHGCSFFDCYRQAMAANQRMDGRKDAPSDLIVHQDDHVMLFVPKAQTSQWELQLMTQKPVGNVLEADETVRRALDNAMLIAMRLLTAMGAAMITVIEYSKRFQHRDSDQRLLYAFLPRLPESPGAFSENQLRWINGHYPEDFAAACRLRLDEARKGL